MALFTIQEIYVYQVEIETETGADDVPSREDYEKAAQSAIAKSRADFSA